MQRSSASAPGKIILFGEHAVVYGMPAIAIPVPSMRAVAIVEPARLGAGIHFDNLSTHQHLQIDPFGNVADPITQIVRLVMVHFGIESIDVTITLESSIPIASGLGSGAAVSAAVGRALARYLGSPLDDTALNAMVYEVEKLHHGTPSGIDNTVIVFEQPIFFQRDRPIESLSIGGELRFLIVDTGCSAPTRQVVEDVRLLYDRYSNFVLGILDEIGVLVVEAWQALGCGDALAVGALMSANHALLQSLTVSSPALDVLVSAACESGALGAKLSGGGRGGNMIALVASENARTVMSALLAAGAARVVEMVLP
jgi:mevalonate kinase